MPKVRSYAIMEVELEWEGYVPDDEEPEDYWIWIKENVDGGEFVDTQCGGSWRWGQDVEVIEEDDPPAATE